MTALESLQRRFNDDPHFRATVDMLTHMIMSLQLSPSEIREAAMFAVFRAEMLQPAQRHITLSRAALEAILADGRKSFTGDSQRLRDEILKALHEIDWNDPNLKKGVP